MTPPAPGADAPASPGSTALTRWGGPGAVIWAGLMLSAWVHTEKLKEPEAVASWKLALLFLGVPAVQALSLVSLRRALDSRRAGRGADLVVLWLTTFLFGLHAALLATAIGMISSVARAMPIAIGLLMVGVAPALAVLEPGSPLGIRTRATLAHPGAWRRAHRFAGVCFAVAGLLAPAGLLVEGPEAVYAALCPPVLAVGLSILRGATLSPTRSDEHAAGLERLDDEPASDGPEPPEGAP